MSQHLHSGRGLLAQLVQLVIALLNLLVQRLILNFELLEIDEVKPFR